MSERQRSLFDETLLMVETPPARSQPLRRNSDPGTSHEAAEATAVDLGDVQKTVLAFLETQTEELTANEIGQRCREWVLENHGDAKVADSYRKRVGELCNKGFLVACGRRPCTTTKSNGETFKVRK